MSQGREYLGRTVSERAAAHGVPGCQLPGTLRSVLLESWSAISDLGGQSLGEYGNSLMAVRP